MKKEHKNLILGVVIGIVIVALILIIYNANKPQPTQKLIDDDFKIISASWNDYYFDTNTGKFTTIQIDWDRMCAAENGNNTVSIDYSITTQQTEDLTCNYIINGEEKKKEVNTEGWVFEKNRNFRWGFYDLNFKQSNQITLCCHSNYKEGEVCKSITLPAKCSYNQNSQQPQTYCGDGICQSNEDCSSCSADCGSCGKCYYGNYAYYACVVNGGDLVFNNNMVIFSSELAPTKYGEKCKFLQFAKNDTVTFRLVTGARGELYNDNTGEKETSIANAYNVNSNYNCVFNSDCSFTCNLYSLFEQS